MKLGIDIDGVICDFVGLANAYLAEHANCEPLEVRQWNWYLDYPNGEKLWEQFWSEAVSHDHVLRWARPVAGAVTGVKTLAADHDLTFITYRPDHTKPDTFTWLRLHGLGVIPVVHAEDKSTVPCDFYVDDHPETVRYLRAKGLNAVLFKQPWNSDHWFSVPSVGGWGELVMAFNGWLTV